MKSRKFNLHSNIYISSTPIDEQVSIWLDMNPTFIVTKIQLNKNDALVFYKESEDV